MRVFKLKAFARFQRRESLPDEALCRAVRDAEAGLIDADLGGGLIKQRVARAGGGKRGGYRTLIAIRLGDRSIFLVCFAKNDRDNIDADELPPLRARAQMLLALPDDEIEALIANGDMMEVYCERDA